MQKSDEVDILVIGGGPAGSTAASMAAKSGLSVKVCERSKFPREHVGESLLPASIGILEELGLNEAISNAGFLPKYGATMVWGKDETPWSWRFSETNKQNIHSYQVSRPIFDEILLKRSAELGVLVEEESSVSKILTDDSNRGVVVTNKMGQEYFQPAKFIVDASGQSALLARNFDLRQWDEHFQNLAIYGYFAGAKKLDAPNENNIFIESYENGWVWAIPLNDDTTSVGAVVDSNESNAKLRKTDPITFLKDQLSMTNRTSHMLSEAELKSDVKILKDWSYTTSKMAGDGWVLAGDAACFIDPLFSSGVHLAMMSGVLASAYAVTYLKDKILGKESASVYETTFRQEYDHFRDLALLFYSSNRTVDSYFWEARRIFKEENYFSDRISFIRAVSGQSVRGYERVALERGELPNEFMSAMSLHNKKSEDRNAKLLSIQDSILEKIPCLAPEAELEKKPVLAEGEFEWGTVITTPYRKEGVPCSNFVANLLMEIDGEKSLSKIVEGLSTSASEDTKKQLLKYSIEAISILFIEGVIDNLD